MERLERQNRWMKCALILLVVASASVALIGATAAPSELKVRALYVVDDQGRTGIKLHGPDGLGSISFWDANLKKWQPQISIGCIGRNHKGGGGTQIFMKNGKGERAINLIAQRRGNIHTW